MIISCICSARRELRGHGHDAEEIARRVRPGPSALVPRMFGFENDRASSLPVIRDVSLQQYHVGCFPEGSLYHVRCSHPKAWSDLLLVVLSPMATGPRPEIRSHVRSFPLCSIPYVRVEIDGRHIAL